jgi:chromosome partitioning protein
VIIDCPPSFGMLTVNALVASDYILIPLLGEFLPRKGVESFLRLLTTLKEMLNIQTEVLGFVLTRFSPRKTINRDIKEWLENEMPYPLFQTFIHADIKLAMSQRKGEDIFTFAPESQGAQDYRNLSSEILSEIRSRQQAYEQSPIMETVSF